MFILGTVSILLIAGLVLLVFRFTMGEYRYSWLIGTGGALLAWVSTFLWQLNMPQQFQFPLWQPAFLFNQSPFFFADSTAWIFAVSLVSMCLAVVITAVARENFPYPLSWIGILIMTAFGILAVTAENPVTLVLLWAAIDIVELISQMRLVENPQLSERVVIAFASRVAGILILLWADMISTSKGIVLDFRSAPTQAGLYFVIAAGLRLGVLPLHLPYSGESSIRRGFGTGLRMISAGSSLILLARIPAGSLATPATPYLMFIASFTAVYGAWMWLRAPEELTGRPFWVIGMGSLAIAAALRSNSVGATSLSCALILTGSALFLASAKIKWLERLLFIAVWAISALPFTLTATAWNSTTSGNWFFVPFLLIAQAMLIAGVVRHIQRSTARLDFAEQPLWARNVYPIGILLLLINIIGLTLAGWDGALQIGNWFAGLSVSLLAAGLIWLTPRLRILNPVRAHWVRPDNPSWLDWIYQATWNGYQQLSRLSNFFSSVLEGESGIMWTLLLLVLFFAIFIRRSP